MLTVAAGPQGVWLPGSVVDVEPATAQALVAGGYAVTVDALPLPATPPATTTAAVQPPETPERKTAGRRARRK